MPSEGLYQQVAALGLEIDGIELTRHEREVRSEQTRVTTVVSLHGGGEIGRGEDVTYTTDAHDTFRSGHFEAIQRQFDAFDTVSTQLAQIDLFPEEDPEQQIFRNYRRWAIESAALDLALRQAGTNLGKQLGRAYDPVRFVFSTRLEDPQSGGEVHRWLERNPALEFKLDPTSDWTQQTIDELAATDAVRILDLKGQYEGTTVDQPADPALYERVLDGFPAAIIEDPALTEETRPLFDGGRSRVAWDYPIRDVESVESLPWEPNWLNIKPSRFGTAKRLLDTIEYGLSQGIAMFGGGQFELDVGREHLHTIASLFYPSAPNDVAPRAYNDADRDTDLPRSPLIPKTVQGLSWTEGGPIR